MSLNNMTISLCMLFINSD